jgi:diadenosine tetraphosphate (Ap4A) HIT family hydrolase
MSTLIHRRVRAARQGTNPTVICRVSSGWIVLCDVQVVLGQSILLPDPVVPDLNALKTEQRINFLQDMAMLGDALLEVTGAVRINYEILGNTEPALHAHVIPRYTTEPEDKLRVPIWFYDWKSSPQFNLGRDRQLMDKIAKAIERYQKVP